MSLVFYCRVSSVDQNLDRQLARAKEVGADKVFSDKFSGKTTNRPAFHEMMDHYLREGDVLQVVSLDRLSRDYNDIKRIMLKLKQMKVKLVVDDLPVLQTGNPLVDEYLQDMIIGLMGFVAQNEREKIKERQAQGIAIAKAEGRYTGGVTQYGPDLGKHYSQSTKAKSIVWERAINMLASDKPYTYNEIARQCRISRQQVYRIRDRARQRKFIDDVDDDLRNKILKIADKYEQTKKKIAN